MLPMPSSPDSFQSSTLLNGKTAVIIGGAGFLGSQISQVLLDHGSTVVIASRNQGEADLFRESQNNEIAKKRIFHLKVDITSDNSVSDLVKIVGQEFTGGIDILVNCGWSGKKNSLDSISIEDWQYDLEVCLTGVFRTIIGFLPQLKQNKGNILNIASMYGQVAPDYRLYDDSRFVNPPSYGAAKAGVIQLTKYLASFLSKDGVRVNCISPGPFPFPETQAASPEFIEKLAGMTPLGRIGEPAEIQGLSLLLCSELGSYINGQNFGVDGGWTSW
jgi:NAD(P)-dependent dehydrogenase (short-subunit alcohol dehydrogenase family)